ncbi:hypothetical protein [Epilithonimonas hungarica]|uniref:Uncharacterized protein n=1 Tax=Epilithonimonas hungarica TaxID=454006 RepID=A0A1G7LNG8_9FLAO|nr:hypothetical protein [Epilithonimonas hungarica]SDF51068.1 hypothetical protein SAMN05421825_1554 [Epilithonimonas hungarica]
MYNLVEEKLIQNKGIRKVNFENEFYFSIEDIAMEIKEDLSDVKGITLPINEKYIEVARISDIEKGRKKNTEELSEFNQALLKARNFKKDKEN